MPPDGRSRPARRLHRDATDVESTTLHKLPMAFEWLPCPDHPHLGVSILVSNTFSPLCFLEDGSTHAVNRIELRKPAS